MASTIHSLSDPQARADALASRMQFPTHITPELATAYNDVVNDAARLPKSDDAYRCVVLVTFILHRCSDGRPYMRLEQLQSAEDMKPFSEHVGRMFSDATHPLRIPASCRASFRRLADAARRITPPRASTYYTELADAIDGAMESQPAHPGQ